MLIKDFLVYVSATLGFCGGVFVLLGTFRLSSDLIARLAAMPYGGFSLERLRTLSRQKAHLLSGTLLVFLAVGIQVYPMFFVLEQWVILGDRHEMATYAAVAVGIAVVLGVYRLNVMLSNQTENRAKRMVLKNRLERALKQNPIGQVYWSSAIEGAESLLGLKRKTNEPVAEFLRRLAKELRVAFPSDVHIEDEHKIKLQEFSPAEREALPDA
ncbi:MAG TPA: hypothetical protein VGB25_02035 [Candidatus Binatia bacterium]